MSSRAFEPNVVTESGIVSFVIPVQPLNAEEYIFVTLDGISMFFRDVQPVNTASPIDFTELPITTSFIFLA